MTSADVAPVPGALAVGRYFTVVSLVPSTIFVAYLTLLVRSGAWGGGVVHFAGAIGHISARDLAESGIASLVIAITLHPLQFALIQLFEGFWGSSKLATRLALRNLMRHRRRAVRLHDLALNHDLDARPDPDRPGVPNPPYAAHPDASRDQVNSLLKSVEAWRQYNDYPHQLDRVMPTRLGNVLRHYEVLAGSQYGLDTIASVPHLLQVADARDVAYVQNQRMQMEFALRTSALALAASVVTLIFMWRHGPWLFLGIAPYAVAFAAYRGAAVIAHEYGTSLAVLIDLNRFALYDRMHLPVPEDIEDEREDNGLLISVLRLDNIEVEKRLNEAFLDYVHPVPSTSTPASTSETPAASTARGDGAESALQPKQNAETAE